MTFIHYLIITVIAGFFTILAIFIKVRWTEYYRQRSILESEFEKIIDIFDKNEPSTKHPTTYIESRHINLLVQSFIKVMPPWKSNSFRTYWNECRYDKEIPNMIPREYTQKSPDSIRRLISDKLHILTSKL